MTAVFVISYDEVLFQGKPIEDTVDFKTLKDRMTTTSTGQKLTIHKKDDAFSNSELREIVGLTKSQKLGRVTISGQIGEKQIESAFKEAFDLKLHTEHLVLSVRDKKGLPDEKAPAKIKEIKDRIISKNTTPSWREQAGSSRKVAPDKAKADQNKAPTQNIPVKLIM